MATDIRILYPNICEEIIGGYFSLAAGRSRMGALWQEMRPLFYSGRPNARSIDLEQQLFRS